MSDWTIPGNHTTAKDFGADLDLSFSRHDYKAQRFLAVLEMRNGATKEWLGPQVTISIDMEGTKITKFDGTIVEFAPTFDHPGVQGLLDRAKIVNFVSAKLPDPRP